MRECLVYCEFRNVGKDEVSSKAGIVQWDCKRAAFGI